MTSGPKVQAPTKERAVMLSQPPGEEEGQELTSVWIVTYCDMTTLLLAFFLIIYSFTVLGEQRQGELVRELNQLSISPINNEPKQAENLERTAREIARRFGRPGGEKAWVDATESEVTVGLPASVTFDLAEAVLKPLAEEQLGAVASMLKKLPNIIRVEGHTDDLPIRGRRFPTNWHLSVARSQSVVRLFIDKGLHPQRLQVVGYSDTRPRRPNTSDENRQANRRIEIKIVRSGH